MTSYLIKNCIAVNEGKQIVTDILLKNQRIEKIAPNISVDYDVIEVDGTDLYALPGVIDDQVHFREPGLTHKANIYTESKAAVAGGVTSFMEMPNTNPPAFTVDLLNDKFNIAKHTSLANHSFFMGTSNDNYEEIMKINKLKNEVCGVKIFMGSSTGNLLVDNPVYLNKIFAGCEVLIATHCEEEALINRNLENFKQHSMALTAESHPIIRDEKVCYASSLKAIQLAQKNNTRLHILHISTAKELILFGNMVPLENKKITSEVCVHHLHFTSDDYANLGYQIKCNPAIKSGNNKEALWKALLDDRLDIIATDHAPHLLTEKGFDENGNIINNSDYFKAHAGLPLVQHSLQLMMHYVQKGFLSIEKMVEKMSHNVAICFDIKERGFLREGYFADIVLVNPNKEYTITKNNILYKCGWSPLENFTMPSTIEKTFVNGNLVYGNNEFDESVKGLALQFDRS
jgi:dihydroorotase